MGDYINPAYVRKVVQAPAKASAPSQAGQGITTTTIHARSNVKRAPTPPTYPDPYSKAPLNQGFTYNPATGKGHPGWDIDAPMNTPVFAPVSGVVIATKKMDPWGWGNSIEIQTPDGYHVYFAHLSKFNVQPGEAVTGGQQIGLSGDTFTPGVGYSSGPHLHFEVRTGTSPNTAIDPATFFAQEASSTALPAWGTTITMGGPAESMGASSAPTQNLNGSPASPKSLKLSSPSNSSLQASAAQPASGSGSTISQFAAGVASGAVGAVSEPSTTGTGTVQKAVSNAVGNAATTAASGILSSIFTLNNSAIIAGAIMVIIGLVGITWKPVIKPAAEEGARVAGVAAKAALAG